jgi:sugar phosphate permease
MATKSARLKRVQTISLTLLVAAGLFAYLDRGILAIAQKDIIAEMGLTATQFGSLAVAFSLPYAFAQLPIGVLLDRLGARITMGLGIIVWSAGQLAGGLVHGLAHFQIARGVLGIGEAPAFPAGAKVFSEWFAIKERGRPTGIYVASTTAAPAIAPFLLTGLMLWLGWRGMFVVMGAVGILVGLAWYSMYRDRKEVPLTPEELDYLNDGVVQTAAAGSKITQEEWAGILGKRTTWGIILSWVGVIYMVFLYLTWLPGYLQTERGLSVKDTAIPLTIVYIFGTLGQLSSGVVADFLVSKGVKPIASRKWPICIGLVFAALFTVPAAYATTLAGTIACLSAAMYFINLASGAGWALVSVSAPRRLVATLGSFMNFGGYLAGAAAPIITGFIVDQTGSFILALLISGGVAIFSALANLLVVKDPIANDDKLLLSSGQVWSLRGVAVLVGAFSGYLIAVGIGANPVEGAGSGALVAAIGVFVIPAMMKRSRAARSAA